MTANQSRILTHQRSINTYGNVDAINAVLKHYEGYIFALSTKRLYDENGQPHMCVDEGLRRRLETKLITKILTFDVA